MFLEVNGVKNIGLFVIMIIVVFGHAFSQEKRIQDNSFLIEEAYNQEDGVIQHISAFQCNKDKSWFYTFTQEWTVPKQTHQLSFMLPISSLSGIERYTSIGDILLNYRYQLVFEDHLAIAPRLSLVLSTGSYKKGLGRGGFGFQANLLLNYEVSEKFVTQINLGSTYTP
jgi:hypothetical protein